MGDVEWATARAGMLLDPDTINLNSGSGAPLPRSVFDRITALRRRLAEAPMAFLLGEVPPLLRRARLQLSSFIGVEPHRLAFASNVTEAINLVASSLALVAPGEILLTDQEYLPMRWCWERAARRLGLEIRTFQLPCLPEDPEEIVAAATAAMTSRTRLFAFSHVVAATGLVLPAARLCQEARQRGILTLVDGAHAPGHLDLDVSSLGCDFYAGSGHKWLLGPTGIGFLCIGDENDQRLEPLQVSWAYQPPADCGGLDQPDRFGSTSRLRRFECQGTRDITPWLAIPEALELQADLGQARIRSRMRQLADYTRTRVGELPGFLPATPPNPVLSGAMTTFRLPNPSDPAVIARTLWKRFRIEVAAGEQAGFPSLRVSTHFYNTEAEIDHLTQALEAMLVSG